MKLNIVTGSPNARKVLAVLNHLDDLDIEKNHLDFFEGDLAKPGYLAINPNGMVPSLEDGDLILWESNAINQYICDNSSNKTLYPQNIRIRAEINRWLFWEVSHYNKALSTIAFEEVAKPIFMGAEGNPELISNAKENLKRFATILYNHMNGREFVVGDTITIADYALTHIEFSKDKISFDWSDYPHVNSMYERIRQNDNWTSTAPTDPSEFGRRPVSQLFLPKGRYSVNISPANITETKGKFYFSLSFSM
jgi:glutathione S-transferase